jgi:hypothetical protein
MYATGCFYEPDSAVDIFTRLGYVRAESRGSNSEGGQKLFSGSVGEYVQTGTGTHTVAVPANKSLRTCS